MNNCIEEQETTICFDRVNKGASVWTSDRTVITKLDKLVLKSDSYTSKEVRTKDGDLIAKEYFISDKSLIAFRAGKRVMTEEQKEKAAARLRSFKNNP